MSERTVSCRSLLTLVRCFYLRALRLPEMDIPGKRAGMDSAFARTIKTAHLEVGSRPNPEFNIDTSVVRGSRRRNAAQPFTSKSGLTLPTKSGWLNASCSRIEMPELRPGTKSKLWLTVLV